MSEHVGPGGVTTWFWPLVGVFWLVGTRFVAPWIARGGANLSTLDALCRRLGVFVFGLCLLLWAIQLSAGPVGNVQFASWPAPQRWLALGVVLLAFLAAATWVFLGGGARRLADAFGTGEGRVKAVAGVLLLVATAQNAAAFVV